MYRVAQTARGADTITRTAQTETRGYPGMASVFPPVTPLQGVSGYRLIAKSLTPAVGIFQTGALRAPEGPQTAFASEQMIDMLAEAAGMDPYAFRVQNMRTDTYGEDWEGSRWVGALDAAVSAAKADGYVPHVPGSQLKSGNVVSGWGMAIGTHHEPYGATVAHVTVNKKTGKITVNHLWGAQDSGFAVNPGLLENQMVGNLIQATSKVLHEELQFDKKRVTSRDWVTLPDPALQGRAEGDADRGQPPRSAADRRGRAADRPDRRRDRERGLRRHGRPHDARAADAGRVRGFLRNAG